MGDRVAIITGAASGIGRAFAEELGRQDVEVVLADRQLEAAEAIANEIRAGGGQAVAAELDVRDASAFGRLAGQTADRTGRIDYLFNNAGIGIAGEMTDYELDHWNEVLDVNVRGVAYGIQAVYPIMSRQGFGHIINTASMAGLLPGAGAGNYTASKHAVVGLSKALRIEAKQHGVRVSVLCPGVIRTEILTGGKYGSLATLEGAEDKVMEFWEKLKPMDPNVFARRALEDIARNKLYVIVPRWWKALWYLERLSPSLSVMLWERMFRRTKRELEPFQTSEPQKPGEPVSSDSRSSPEVKRP